MTDFAFTFQGVAETFAGLCALFLAGMVVRLDRTVRSLMQTIEGQKDQPGLIANVRELLVFANDVKPALKRLNDLVLEHEGQLREIEGNAESQDRRLVAIEDRRRKPR